MKFTAPKRTSSCTAAGRAATKAGCGSRATSRWTSDSADWTIPRRTRMPARANGSSSSNSTAAGTTHRSSATCSRRRTSRPAARIAGFAFLLGYRSRCEFTGAKGQPHQMVAGRNWRCRTWYSGGPGRSGSGAAAGARLSAYPDGRRAGYRIRRVWQRYLPLRPRAQHGTDAPALPAPDVLQRLLLAPSDRLDGLSQSIRSLPLRPRPDWRFDRVRPWRRRGVHHQQPSGAAAGAIGGEPGRTRRRDGYGIRGAAPRRGGTVAAMGFHLFPQQRYRGRRAAPDRFRDAPLPRITGRRSRHALFHRARQKAGYGQLRLAQLLYGALLRVAQAPDEKKAGAPRIAAAGSGWFRQERAASVGASRGDDVAAVGDAAAVCRQSEDGAGDALSYAGDCQVRGLRPPPSFPFRLCLCCGAQAVRRIL